MSKGNNGQERREDTSTASNYDEDLPPKYGDIKHGYPKQCPSCPSDNLSPPPQYSEVIKEEYSGKEKS